jgi:hypothetical protein
LKCYQRIHIPKFLSKASSYDGIGGTGDLVSRKYEVPLERSFGRSAEQRLFDIGGTRTRADAASIWIAQFVGQKINVYEAQGQELSRHIDWMRRREWGRARVILPHD